MSATQKCCAEGQLALPLGRWAPLFQGYSQQKDEFAKLSKTIRAVVARFSAYANFITKGLYVVLRNTKTHLSKFHGPYGPKLHSQNAAPYRREKMRPRRQYIRL